MPHLDEPRAVRTDEHIDTQTLTKYLAEQLKMPVEDLEVLQFPGGHSNLTYLVRVADHEYVLRRPPHGSKVRSAHDMGREYRVLNALAPVYARAPKPHLYCEDAAVLGAPFYLMERVRGTVLRRKLPANLELSEQTARGLCVSFVDALGELHTLDYRAVGLGDLGKPEGYVARQVQGWTQRYHDARTDDVPAMDKVAHWLADNRPPESGTSLIHNDFKFDNLVLNPDDLTDIRAVLDWEMATVGDPLMDLGSSLAYWVQANDPAELQMLSFGPTFFPGMMTRQDIVEAYAKRTGRALDDIRFYYSYGLFKTAVIVQQIYYRFQKGLTQDPRFASMNAVVALLAEQAARNVDGRGL